MSAVAPAPAVVPLGSPFVRLTLPIEWGGASAAPAASATSVSGAAPASASTSAATGGMAPPPTQQPAAPAAADATKSPAFFDNLHAEVIVLRPSKALVSNKHTGQWTEYPMRVSIAEVVDAKLSPSRSMLALRVANREVVGQPIPIPLPSGIPLPPPSHSAARSALFCVFSPLLCFPGFWCAESG
jgi:hypothetical protein